MTDQTGYYINLIENLSCVDVIKEKILLGVGVNKIAAYVQDELGQARHIPRSELIRAIKVYAEKVMPPAVVKNIAPNLFKEVKETVKDFNVVKEMIEMYNLQKQRINIDFELEKKMKKLLPNTGKEVAIAVQTLRHIYDIMQEEGLTSFKDEPLPDERVIELTKKYGPEVGAILDDDNKRHFLLNFAQQILELGAEENIKIDQTDIEVETKEYYEPQLEKENGSEDN